MELLPNNLDTLDKTLLTTSSLSLLGDWAQTRDVARNHHKYTEINPLLPAKPKIDDVNRYFALAGLGNYLVGNNLTPTQRKLLWGAVTALQLNVMRNNKKIGVGFNFKY